MNNFCNPIDLKLNPLVEEFNFKSINLYHSKVDLKYLNPDLIGLLDSIDIEINLAPVFLTHPRQQSPIHLDGNGKSKNFIKLNFVINEEDSHMIWYNPIIDKSQISATTLNTPYINYDKNEVKEIHRQQLRGCALVQVAVPHNVEVFSKSRYCLSLPLWKKSNHCAITMEEGLELFKEYIL